MISDEELEPTQRRDPLIGATLGGYVVKELLGRGGMGVVYLAEQPDIAKKVAIKVLKQEGDSEPGQLDRLAREARIVSSLRHRGIIDVFGFGTTPDGRPYLVMEYLEGEPLDVHLARVTKLSPIETVNVLDEVLAAVGAAHRAGVVHRDLKPGNIFRAVDSNGAPFMKVLDFGLAKRAESAHGSVSQTAQRPAGTPDYMAPEQARGERVGPHSDLYAVGALAYELLTGHPPFVGGSYVEILMKQIQEPPCSISSRDPSVPVAFDAIVLDLLRKNPSERPHSAEEVRARLKQVERSLAQAGTNVTLPRINEPVAEPGQALTPKNVLEGTGPLTPLPPTDIRPAVSLDPEAGTPAAPTAIEHRALRPRWLPLTVAASALVLGAVGAALWTARPSAREPEQIVQPIAPEPGPLLALARPSQEPADPAPSTAVRPVAPPKARPVRLQDQLRRRFQKVRGFAERNPAMIAPTDQWALSECGKSLAHGTLSPSELGSLDKTLKDLEAKPWAQ